MSTFKRSMLSLLVLWWEDIFTAIKMCKQASLNRENSQNTQKSKEILILSNGTFTEYFITLIKQNSKVVTSNNT